MSIRKALRYYEDIALSNYDILKKLNGKTNIILYPDLHKYHNIDEILEPYGVCVLLFESKKNYGHWCCILKIDNTIEFFNPYGGYPDDTLKFIPLDFRKISYQIFPYLSILLYDSPYNLTYNEFPLQKHKSNIRTCGRHCICRIMYRDLNLYEYIDMLNYYKNKYAIDYDKIVTLITI